ncbi:MAG TPA: hypothetical protein VFV47_11930 [Hyphomicrobiaceae bacterium]|nr:hypothetical protein [Hyphomicrobiaceae bacterium]
MGVTIVGHFASRREAELAIEHLVQEYGIERTDVFVEAQGPENSSGTKAAGADVESGHPSVAKDGDPALRGPIQVSVDCDQERSNAIQSVLRDLGANNIRMH